MKKFAESGSEKRENVNISKTGHAIHAQPDTIMHLTSDLIVLKCEANRTVTF